MSALMVGVTIAAIVGLFGAWRLAMAWRDVKRERREQAEREGRDAR